MAAVENLGGREILQVLVVGDDVDGGARTVKVVAPDAERFKDGEEFLVMDIVVELRRVERAGVESDRVYFTVL